MQSLNLNTHFSTNHKYSNSIHNTKQTPKQSNTDIYIPSNTEFKRDKEIYSIHLDIGGGSKGTHSHIVEQSIRSSSELEVIGSHHLAMDEFTKAIEQVKRVRNGEIENVPSDTIVAVTMSYCRTSDLDRDVISNGILKDDMTQKNKEEIEDFRRFGIISTDLKPLIWDFLRQKRPELYDNLQNLKKLAQMDNVFVTSSAGNGSDEFDFKSLIDEVITVADPDKGNYAFYDTADAEFPTLLYNDPTVKKGGTSSGSPFYLGEYLSTLFRPNHENLEYKQNISILAESMGISKKDFKTKYPKEKYKIADVDSEQGKIVTILKKDTQNVVYTYGVNRNGEEFRESPLDLPANLLINLEDNIKDPSQLDKLTRILENPSNETADEILGYPDKWSSILNLNTKQIQRVILNAIPKSSKGTLQYANQWVPISQLDKKQVQEIILNTTKEDPTNTLKHAGIWIPISGLEEEKIKDIIFNAAIEDPSSALKYPAMWTSVSRLDTEQIKEIILNAVRETPREVIDEVKTWASSSGLDTEQIKDIFLSLYNEKPGNVIYDMDKWIPFSGLDTEQIKDIFIAIAQDTPFSILSDVSEWIPISGLNTIQAQEVISIAKEKDKEAYNYFQDEIQVELDKLSH